MTERRWVGTAVTSAIKLALLVCLVGAVGCTPRTFVRKNPDDRDCGIRYYRPKPYLMIEPMLDRQGAPVDGYVTLSRVMLPDFSEEYSIHIRSGLGVNNTSVVLEDGWNLTKLDVDIDSQFDESLRAAAELAKALPIATAGGGVGDERKTPVRAVNVPIGLYESVVSAGRDGKKRLYGFRYVGFLPYASCPVESGGLECHSCDGGGVYALTFNRDGAMEFRPLPEVAMPLDQRTTLGASPLAGQLPPELPRELPRAGGSSWHPPTVTGGSPVDLLEDDDRAPL